MYSYILQFAFDTCNGFVGGLRAVQLFPLQLAHLFMQHEVLQKPQNVYRYEGHKSQS